MKIIFKGGNKKSVIVRM